MHAETVYLTSSHVMHGCINFIVNMRVIFNTAYMHDITRQIDDVLAMYPSKPIKYQINTAECLFAVLTHACLPFVQYLHNR